MIELLGFIYGAGKEIVKYLTWKEEDKEVELSWLEKSGFKELIEKEGVEIFWLKAKKLETKLLEGYEVCYEIDADKKVRRRIIVKDGYGKTDLILVQKL